jgi:CubicO group peptidase (beta-lactamase class C family)
MRGEVLWAALAVAFLAALSGALPGPLSAAPPSLSAQEGGALAPWEAAALPPQEAAALPDTLRPKLDQVFAFIEADAPGCALGIIRDGELVYGRGYGLANLDWAAPIGTSTVFDIASVSKQFTATAVALLDMDGVLSLDDDVRRWVPELPDYGVTITIRQLLNHTGGLRDYLTLLSLAGFDFDNVFDEGDGVRLIVRQRAPNFEPGSEYLYSNSGYLLLANIVRRASGTSLREFLQARVFEPLGMSRTSIWDRNTEVLRNRATGYSRAGADGWRINHAWNFQMGGDGQVITSVEDLARWDANFYHPVVGGQGLLDRLHTRGVLSNGDTISYALGLTLDQYRGLSRVQHGGSWAGFRSQLTRFPEQRTSIVIQCNRSDANPGAYATAVADLVLGDVFPEPPPPRRAGVPAATEAAGAAPPEVATPPEILAPLAGAYRHEARPEYRFFAVRDGALWLDAGGGTRLMALSDSSFQAPAGGATFTFHATPEGVRLEAPGATLLRVPDYDPSAVELAELAGRYASDELEAVFEIGVDGDRLTLRRPRNEPVPLRPGGPDEFVAPGSTLTFLREEREVTGFRVYAGRVTGIEFVRMP